MQAAAESGATAVHPGYGFLSESPEFVAAVEGAGMQWLGPRGKTMSDFALKHVAKDMAVAAGVPILEGSPLVATAEGAPRPLCSPAVTPAATPPRPRLQRPSSAATMPTLA